MMKKIKNFIHYCIVYVKTGKFMVVTPHRLEMLQKAMQYVKNEKVSGEYFEFGVARGLTFSAAYHLSKKYKTAIQTYYAFDSFEGFPELGSVDSEFERFKAGEESWSEKSFTDTLKKNKVPLSKIQMHTGWFVDTLSTEFQNQLVDEKIKGSVIWIDCDLYESASSALQFIEPLLHNGTVVVFDDWYCYHSDPQKGEQRALSEFLEAHPQITFQEYHKFGIVGNSFIVNRNSDHYEKIGNNKNL